LRGVILTALSIELSNLLFFPLPHATQLRRLVPAAALDFLPVKTFSYKLSRVTNFLRVSVAIFKLSIWTRG
jgi:hypothetical protein